MRRDKPRILLVFGNPDAGKSWLANELKSRHGYEVISLDEVYVSFIKEKYPSLYLDNLNLVISQHYDMILLRTQKDGKKNWREYVISLVKERAKQYPLLVVEGYLLHPILDALRSKLSKVATITTVHVNARKYFLNLKSDI